MKYLKTLDDYLQNLKDDEFCIASTVVGTKNLLIVDSEHFKLSKAWITEELSSVPACVIAHGFNGNGEIAVCTKEIPLVVLGKGKKTGFALFIQNMDNVFYIAVCNDTKEKHERFFLTGTDDKSIPAIILSVIERYLSSAEIPDQIASFINNEENE